MSKLAQKSARDYRAERGARRAHIAVEEARAAGLLEGDKDHVTFRVPRALLDAAQRNTGIQRKTDLGLAAFALLAERDPTVEFMMANYGALGPDHTLDF